jgi:hypothetical protein
MELESTDQCTGYDHVSVAGELTINASTLQLVLLNGYTPSYGDSYDILDWGSLNGAFGIIDTSAAALPTPLVWDFTQLYLDGTVQVGVNQFADGDLAPWGAPDGIINAADLMIAQRLVLGTLTAGAVQLAHGDMDLDDDIDTADLFAILALVLNQ